MDLYTYTYQNVPAGWEDLFKSARAEIEQISSILEEEKKTYRIVPDQENIFRVFYMCKPQDLTVVITGADPYFQILPNGKPRALGYSFSVSEEDKIPSSLQNIYKEIKSCYPNSVIPTHGDISHWVPQGVFLLNASLTCRVNEPGSHVNKYKLWTPFINKFVKFMATVNKNLIWVLWGKDSQKFEELIDKSFNNILNSAHPSGLSAMRGFFGCNHFKIINEKLISMNRTPIVWLPQLCSNKEKVDGVISVLNEDDVNHLLNFYEKDNYMKMDSKHFCISTYIDNLSKLYKQDINKCYDDFVVFYTKYNDLQDTVDGMNRYYNGDKIQVILYNMKKEMVKSLTDFYREHFKSEFKMNLVDFSLQTYLKNLYDSKYNHLTLDEFFGLKTF
jgi:uracil-DNA glycosylase